MALGAHHGAAGAVGDRRGRARRLCLDLGLLVLLRRDDGEGVLDAGRQGALRVIFMGTR
uniref:Uncharacterized protein n=1 Tax=Janibacter limosus TaxID=53458 RepID=A0AC61U9C2_9MICO|nr:hypothetical protein [Janibacter limosus]